MFVEAIEKVMVQYRQCKRLEHAKGLFDNYYDFIKKNDGARLWFHNSNSLILRHFYGCYNKGVSQDVIN
ncbi:hypothetical protein [Enterobacter cloacae]